MRQHLLDFLDIDLPLVEVAVDLQFFLLALELCPVDSLHRQLFVVIVGLLMQLGEYVPLHHEGMDLIVEEVESLVGHALEDLHPDLIYPMLTIYSWSSFVISGMVGLMAIFSSYTAI